MTEDAFFALIDPVLKQAGTSPDEGEEFRTPPLDVLRYYHRRVRLGWVPILGRGRSVVAVVRQPVDVGFLQADYRRLLTRLAMAVNGRYPFWGRDWHSNGLVLGLTTVVLTPEPIGPEDDNLLRQILATPPLPRQRAVPLGLLRVNLGQEALSFALASGPPGVFTEASALADALTLHLKRYVSLIDV